MSPRRGRTFRGDRVAGEQPDRTAAPAFVQQANRAGRGLALQHQAVQAVAHLGRQHDRRFRLGGVGGEAGGRARQRPPVAGLGQHRDLGGQGARAPGRCGPPAGRPRRPGPASGEPGRNGVGQHLHRPDGGERGGERIPAGAAGGAVRRGRSRPPCPPRTATPLPHRHGVGPARVAASSAARRARALGHRHGGSGRRRPSRPARWRAGRPRGPRGRRATAEPLLEAARKLAFPADL